MHLCTWRSIRGPLQSLPGIRSSAWHGLKKQHRNYKWQRWQPTSTGFDKGRSTGHLMDSCLPQSSIKWNPSPRAERILLWILLSQIFRCTLSALCRYLEFWYPLRGKGHPSCQRLKKLVRIVEGSVKCQMNCHKWRNHSRVMCSTAPLD